MRVYNGCVTRNNIDDRSHRVYFMGYAATKGVFLYFNQDQPFVVRRYHNVWFDQYNSFISIEYKSTPGSLLLHQNPESIIHNSELLNLIPCELEFKATPFIDTQF